MKKDVWLRRRLFWLGLGGLVVCLSLLFYSLRLNGIHSLGSVQTSADRIPSSTPPTLQLEGALVHKRFDKKGITV